MSGGCCSARARAAAGPRSASAASQSTFLWQSFAGPASAHHPEIIGSARCDGLVHYTARAWSTSDSSARAHNDIRVYKSVNNGSWVEVKRGQFTSSNDYEFSGTVSAPQTGSVRLAVLANGAWANGVGGGQTWTTDPIHPATNCSSPTAGDITHTCSSWSVLLDNSASQVTVTYTVTVNGQSQQVNVPAGAKQTHSGPVAEDTSYTVSVAADDKVLQSHSFTVDCVAPASTPPASTPTPSDTEVLEETASGKAVGSLRVSCQGTVRVTMRNRSSERVAYTVKIAKRKHRLSVAAGKTRRWATSAAPRQRAQLWMAGDLLASKRLPRACAAPDVLPDTGQRG